MPEVPASEYPELVRSIIHEGRYLSLATCDGGEPWVAPVEFVSDGHLNLYFVSLHTSRHAGHIGKNSTVAVAIFDSHQPEFTGRGVQIRGRAVMYSTSENPFVTVGGRDDMPIDLGALDPDYRAFRIEPHEVYLVRGYVEKEWRDERVRVPMDL